MNAPSRHLGVPSRALRCVFWAVAQTLHCSPTALTQDALKGLKIGHNLHNTPTPIHTRTHTHKGTTRPPSEIVFHSPTARALAAGKPGTHPALDPIDMQGDPEISTALEQDWSQQPRGLCTAA